MSLLGVKKQNRPIIVAVGLFGAALIYGDGAITPAISVLSALEGFDMPRRASRPMCCRRPSSFCSRCLPSSRKARRASAARSGRSCSPGSSSWPCSASAASRSIRASLRRSIRSTACAFCSPAAYSFLVLGGVFLCVTGAEALYADMGHFGPDPIRLAWHFVVLPSLVLNYAGQAALVLEGAPTDGNIFYRLCPAPLLMPLIVLATVATIIASQSIITGAFSMTRQAIQLGWMPRLAIKQTSSEGYGQIYVGAVNWLLMIVTLGLTLGFGKSDNLAAAYGIAVSRRC